MSEEVKIAAISAARVRELIEAQERIARAHSPAPTAATRAADRNRATGEAAADTAAALRLALAVIEPGEKEIEAMRKAIRAEYEARIWTTDGDAGFAEPAARSALSALASLPTKEAK